MEISLTLLVFIDFCFNHLNLLKNKIPIFEELNFFHLNELKKKINFCFTDPLRLNMFIIYALHVLLLYI